MNKENRAVQFMSPEFWHKKGVKLVFFPSKSCSCMHLECYFSSHLLSLLFLTFYMLEKVFVYNVACKMWQKFSILIWIKILKRPMTSTSTSTLVFGKIMHFGKCCSFVTMFSAHKITKSQSKTHILVILFIYLQNWTSQLCLLHTVSPLFCFVFSFFKNIFFPIL